MSGHSDTLRWEDSGGATVVAAGDFDALLAENQRLRDALTAEIEVLDGYVASCCGDEQRFCDYYGCSTIRKIAGTLRTALADNKPP